MAVVSPKSTFVDVYKQNPKRTFNKILSLTYWSYLVYTRENIKSMSRSLHKCNFIGETLIQKPAIFVN
jgi:hypothetical protein